MNGWLYYSTKSLAVVPYMAGTPVYRDGMLPHVYFKLKEEGKVAATFCGEEKNLDAFVSYFDRIKTAQILCRVRENDTLDPVGISWLDLPRGEDGARACQCGMAFWGGATKTEDARNLARLGLAYSFEDIKIDVLHGIQLSSNLAARNFSMKLGFKECAIVPRWHFVGGVLEDARVMILDKSDFMPGFYDWRSRQELAETSQIPVEIPG